MIACLLMSAGIFHSYFSEGGSTNPERNLKLRFAIEEALRRDVPKSTVQTFLKKLADSKDKTTFQRHLFDGRLYKKLHFIIAIFTDSLPHAKIQIATVYRKHLVETTNSKRLFDERGVFNVIARDGITADNIEEECLNDADQCGADDFEVFNAAERKVSFFCDPKEFLKVQNKLTLAGYLIEHSECAFYPKTTAAQLSESELVDYGKFKTKLLNIDGFDEVYDNLAENDDS